MPRFLKPNAMRFSRRQELLATFLLGLLAIGIFNLHYRSPILTTGSDARFSLYVTQALLSTGSIQLDSPLEALGPNIRQDYRIEEIGEHLYYYFPLGSSLFSLPFVWAANQAGYLVDSTQHEDRLQNLIAAILSALIFLVTFAVFRCYGGLWWSTLAATVAMLGSSFSSTLGTGLWTINFATLFVMLSIWLLVRRDSAHSTTVHPLWLGSFLFAAYLARPTTAV
ncbi:MAG: hypothetical protein KC441_05960, partial [Anaerolineales bacterium]|nr:hypothetical protein [Anaerolineales bacterium]